MLAATRGWRATAAPQRRWLRGACILACVHCAACNPAFHITLGLCTEKACIPLHRIELYNKVACPCIAPQNELAAFMGCEEAIIYSYDIATVGSVIPAVANAKDVIVMDEHCSAAAQMGANLSRAKARELVSVLRLLILYVVQDARPYRLPVQASARWLRTSSAAAARGL